MVARRDASPLPKGASAEERADAVGSRPPGSTRRGRARRDDLKRIRGIGPGNERKLNGLGIHHYRPDRGVGPR